MGSNMIEISKGEPDVAARILVVGVGGGGNNAVDRMITSGVTGVEFVCINTDKQQLRNCKAEQCIQIGEKLTRGLGAGADPEKGEKAAEENKDELAEVVRDYDMVIITCDIGMFMIKNHTDIVISKNSYCSSCGSQQKSHYRWYRSRNQ